LRPSDAAANETPGAVDVVGAGREPGVGHRLDRGGDRILRVQIRPLGLLPLHRLQRIERLHLTREAHGKVEASNFVMADAPTRPPEGKRQVVATSLPTGVMAPRPVTTTPTSHYAPTLVFR
jgi:hypothetical protein